VESAGSPSCLTSEGKASARKLSAVRPVHALADHLHRQTFPVALDRAEHYMASDLALPGYTRVAVAGI
jgi:hypothetical protein